MNYGGLVVVLAGIFVLTQVTYGQALVRLNVLPDVTS